MDWAVQTDEMIRTWTDAQRKMWENWLEAMQHMGNASQANATWERIVETWKESSHKALETQVAWTQFWADSMTTNANTPREVIEWTQQVRDTMQQWQASQAQLAENWFETLKKSNPATLIKTWNNTEAQQIVTTWQEAFQKLMEAQFGWLRMWTTAQAQQLQLVRETTEQQRQTVEA